jgi:WD40 repeat protein
MKTTNHEIDPRTATPCRTVAFSKDEKWLVEANYLGFITCRDAASGMIHSRFLAQTALVETIRFEEETGNLMLVGAGFEGRRDHGVAKILAFPSGGRVAELAGHADDATEVISLPGDRRRVATVGLDRKVVVHDLANPEQSWIWDGYSDYLNTCAARLKHPGQFAIAGDSPFTFVLDANTRSVVAQIESPGDCNGLMWSDDGRYLLVGDDHAEVKYFDSQNEWKMVASAKVGGAAKRMVIDPLGKGQILVACYDGRIWSVSQQPDEKAKPKVIVDRRRGLWGINIAASRTRLAVPSFFDRAYLLARDADGCGSDFVGPTPKPTFGANWIALSPDGKEIAISHDDGIIRRRDRETGRLLGTLGPDSDSLYMGACYHPQHRILATIDFYGEVWIYNLDSGKVLWRQDMNFGPGISVDFSPCGRFLAVGGYRWDARVLTLNDEGLPIAQATLVGPNRGVVKSIAFAHDGAVLVASGDGCLVIYRRNGDEWKLENGYRPELSMELSNGVAASPDSKRAYIVSRDQSVRCFDIPSAKWTAVGWAHTRSVKSVHVSKCGRWVASGSYDRTVLVWDAETLQVCLPPLRGANSGISCVRIDESRIFSCSFDGVVTAWRLENGEALWTKTSHDVSRETIS